MAARPKKSAKAVAVDGGERVLLLRTCQKDGTSYNGFKWPTKVGGIATAKDWDPNPKRDFGAGLHGLLWGVGNGALLDWSGEALWLVVSALAGEVVASANGGKHRFREGRVEFIGKGARECAEYMTANGAPAGLVMVGGTATAGYSGTATAGYRGTATAGDRGTATAGYSGTATAGYSGTATAGDSGTATAGYSGTATAGDSGTATAGDSGTATAGYSGTATAGYRGTATAGFSGTATAGYRGTATAGDSGTATAGYSGTATAGYRGTATAGYSGTATAGYRGTATAGKNGAIIFTWYNANKARHEMRAFSVGEDDGDLKPNTPYKLDANGKPVEVKK